MIHHSFRSLLLLFVLPMLFASCLKEQLRCDTQISGQIIDQATKQGVGIATITASNGDRYGQSVRSAADGSFSLIVAAEELADGYFLRITADSLYESKDISLAGILFGIENYDLQDIALAGAEPPTVTTDEPMGIQRNSAICGGTVTFDGRCAVTERGICWNTVKNPTIVNSHLAATSNGKGHFNVKVEGLESGVIYHVRAYATNQRGTVYGQDITFTTVTDRPIVTTETVSSVTKNSAICGGIVTSDNGQPVTTRGVCYSSVSGEPTINDSRTTDGSGTGQYTSHLTNLSSNTRYNYRAYATNAAGTSYGEVKWFQTH